MLPVFYLCSGSMDMIAEPLSHCGGRESPAGQAFIGDLVERAIERGLEVQEIDPEDFVVRLWHAYDEPYKYEEDDMTTPILL